MENKERIMNEVKEVLNETLGGQAVQVTNNQLVKDEKNKNDEAAKEIAESVNELMQGIQLEAQEKPLESKINKDNNVAVEGFGGVKGKANDIMSVFGRTIKQVRQMGDIVNFAKASLDQINELSIQVLGVKLNREQLNELRDAIGDTDIENATEEQLDDIVQSTGHKFVLNTKEGVSIVEAKKIYLLSIVDFAEGYESYDESRAEYEKINEDLMSQMEGLLTNIDLMKQLSTIQEQMENATTEKEKQELNEIYQGIYSLINIGMFISKINLKPINILRKEVKKNYDNVYKKARKTLGQDKNNNYLDIKYLNVALDKAYPDLKEENKMFLYVIYKKINKMRTKENPNLVVFINYFVLTVSKLINKAFENDENYNVMRNKIREAIETFKEN